MLLSFLLMASPFTSRAQSNPSAQAACRARHGMVVSADSLASAAGLEVLRKGGNAIDAAVATGFALGVTFPEAGNIGGGGFMLIRLADGRSTMIDFREKAPLAATASMYLDGQGQPIVEKSLRGTLAAGVPGSPAGFLLALERYGSMKRDDVLKPAIELARKGFRVDRRLASSLQANVFVDRPSGAVSRVFAPRGQAVKEGDTLRQLDLAQTLEMLSERGHGGFYEGPIADLVVASMREGDGIITRQDLASYQAIERPPVTGTFRGRTIISSAPPSAGGILLLEILNILEQFPAKPKGHNTEEAVHLFASAAQVAFADRAAFLGDPDFVKIPTERLLDKRYAATVAKNIQPFHARPSLDVRSAESAVDDNHQTTHFCVADGMGNVVSVTVTLNGLYGCKTLVEGAGFFLNNEMDDFSVKPGSPNMFGLTGSTANAIAPGKRMLSSMTPTIVVEGGKPLMLVGARGGSRIPTAVAQIIRNVIDFQMPLSEAVAALRVHHQWLPDKVLYEAGALTPAVVGKLEAMGYKVELSKEPIARAEALGFEIPDQIMLGAPDAREMGVALGF